MMNTAALENPPAQKRVSAPKRIACIRLTQALGNQPAAAVNIAEACTRFSPQVALRVQEGGGAIFIEVGRSYRLFSEHGFRLRAHALLKRFGWKGEITLASFPGEAWVANQYPVYARNRKLDCLPLSALRDFSFPFNEDIESARQIRLMTERLQTLGFKTVADFMALPSPSLSSRFGKVALETHFKVLGEWEPAWPGFHPQKTIAEEEWIDPTSSLEALSFPLKRLLDQAMARLRAKALRASVIEIEMEIEKWSMQSETSRSWRVSFPVPQGSTSGALPILRERLSFDLNQKPLCGPVECIRVKILETASGRSAQRNFFQSQEKEFDEKDALLGRLSYELGEKQVFHALPIERYLPEKGWVRISANQARRIPAAPRFILTRPSRLLKNPTPLFFLKEETGDWLIDFQNSRRWKILAAKGPERLSGEWWNPQTKFLRDYFRVETESGEILWIFRQRSPDPAFYLHGFFD